MILPWTDDRTAQCKKLWEAGLSASQIAAELGGITRNAVIGKVHRLGLSGRAKAPSAASKPRVLRQPRIGRTIHIAPPQPTRVATALADALAVEADTAPLTYDNVVPLHQPATLFELNQANCHWPVGDPGSADFFFCGGKALGGLPYCAHHSRVAYRPTQDSRRHR